MMIKDRLPPFDLILAGVETFLPDVLVVYLHVEPTTGLTLYSAYRMPETRLDGPVRQTRLIIRPV